MKHSPRNTVLSPLTDKTYPFACDTSKVSLLVPCGLVDCGLINRASRLKCKLKLSQKGVYKRKFLGITWEERKIRFKRYQVFQYDFAGALFEQVTLENR